MNIKEIIKEYLEKNGFDGIIREGCEGCTLDTSSCIGYEEDCQPAYRCVCKCGDHFFSTNKEDTLCQVCRED